MIMPHENSVTQFFSQFLFIEYWQDIRSSLKHYIYTQRCWYLENLSSDLEPDCSPDSWALILSNTAWSPLDLFHNSMGHGSCWVGRYLSQRNFEKRVRGQYSASMCVCVYVCVCVFVCVLVAQSCPTLCDPMDCVHQTPWSMEFSRQEYWSGFAIFFSRGSSWPRDPTWVSWIVGRFFTIWATRKQWSEMWAFFHPDL